TPSCASCARTSCRTSAWTPASAPTRSATWCWRNSRGPRRDGSATRTLNASTEVAMEGKSSRRTRITRATSALFALTLLATPAAAQRVRSSFPVANGGVAAMTMAGDTLFLTGPFTEISPYLGGGIPVHELDATPWPQLAAVDGVVNAAVPDGSGGWFVGGRFEQVGGMPRRNLAHLLANGAPASWRADT